MVRVYTLKGDKSQFDKLAGQNVIIKGKVDGKTITMDSIAAAKSESRYLQSRSQQQLQRRPSMIRMSKARSAAEST
jgi:hypothetical protein